MKQKLRRFLNSFTIDDMIKDAKKNNMKQHIDKNQELGLHTSMSMDFVNKNNDKSKGQGFSLKTFD